MKNKKTLLVILIVLIALLIAGALYFFVLKDKLSGEEEKPTTTTTTTTTTTKPKLKIVDPETKSRPIAVMINNLDAARPVQSGLQDAYIIYEIIVEGGITRYMALFLDQNTERIGSVRSSRHYYLDYVLENDAIYVHHGQSPQAKSDFSKLGIDRVVADNSKTGWREKGLVNPDTGKKLSTEHTLFTSIAKIKNGIGSKRTERKNDLLLDYSIDQIDLSAKEGAKEANKVTIKYSNYTRTSYEYDAENKVYKRFVKDKAHKDYVTKEQYTFKNIITYKIKNTGLGDNKGRQDIDNIGSGEGYYISNGYAVPITWEKKSRGSQTVYKYKNGEELVVNDGNTFIQIQPTGQPLTIE